MKYYAEIGETVTINGITGKCVESDDCSDCVFRENCGGYIKCMIHERQDGKSVRFTAIAEEPQHNNTTTQSNLKATLLYKDIINIAIIFNVVEYIFKSITMALELIFSKLF